jgi:hypothetical protein
MGTTGYNPQGLSEEMLAQMPLGARLLRDEEERKAFLAISDLKSDLYCQDVVGDGWVGCRLGGAAHLTYCTTRPLNWDREKKAAEDKSIRMVEATASPLPTEREWFIPVMDFEGDGRYWIVGSAEKTATEAEMQIGEKKGWILGKEIQQARIVRVVLPCKVVP